MVNCEICKETFETERALSNHIRKHHMLSQEAYYIEYIGDREDTQCKCPGCQKTTKFIGRTVGFTKFCEDHSKLSNVRRTEYWQYLFGMTLEEAKNKVAEIQDMTSESSFVKRYGKEEGIRKFEQFKTSSAVTLDNLISKYGKEEGSKKYEEYIAKQRVSSSKEGMIARYGSERAEEICQSRGLNHFNPQYWTNVGMTEEEAAVRAADERKKANVKSMDFYRHRGISEDEARRLISESQCTFSLAKCKKKYGEVEGEKVFKDRQERWQNTLRSRVDYGDIVNRRCQSFGSSKVADDLFTALYERLPEDLKEKTYFKAKSKEFTKWNGSGIYMYDFVITSIKLCVEFNGDIWHANPSKYSAEDRPNFKEPHLTAAEIWKRDAEKASLLEKEGYEVIVVWESEYNHNTVKQLIERIMEK